MELLPPRPQAPTVSPEFPLGNMQPPRPQPPIRQPRPIAPTVLPQFNLDTMQPEPITFPSWQMPNSKFLKT